MLIGRGERTHASRNEGEGISLCTMGLKMSIIDKVSMKSMFIVHGQLFWTRLVNLEIKYVPTRRESWSKVSGVRMWIISRVHGHGNNKAHVHVF